MLVLITCTVFVVYTCSATDSATYGLG